jgi:hypothetical protein
MATKFEKFRVAWLRGWKVLFMVVGIHVFVWLCSLPIYLLPENVQPVAGVLYLILLWPPSLYWGFSIFFPDAYSTPQSSAPAHFTPKVCFSCTADLPAGSSICPACGWSFQPRGHGEKDA